MTSVPNVFAAIALKEVTSGPFIKPSLSAGQGSWAVTITSVVLDFFLPSYVSSKGSDLGRNSFSSQHKTLLSHCMYRAVHHAENSLAILKSFLFVFPLPVLCCSSLFFTENLVGFQEIRFMIGPAIWKFLLPGGPQTTSNSSGKFTLGELLPVSDTNSTQSKQDGLGCPSWVFQAIQILASTLTWDLHSVTDLREAIDC